MSYLYDCLTRYGDCYELNFKVDKKLILDELLIYKNDWVKYNPRKNIPRYGLSITSLDGGLSGIPDLDSVREYNIKNNLNLDEIDFNKKTELWNLVDQGLGEFDGHLGRTHFIKMDKTGCFPPHRDQYSREINSFRLFIPIKGCNPPDSYFILDNKILNFTDGKVYFINTCKEHTIFTTGECSLFVVANIILSEESVDKVLSNLSIT